MKIDNCKNDIKNTWKLINSAIGKAKSFSCNSLTIDNKITENPQELANSFKDHFSSAPQNLINDLPLAQTQFSKYLKSLSTQSMFVWPTCPIEISNILKTFEGKLSAGPDQIPMKVLKSCSDKILLALSHIFNLSLEKGKSALN